MDASIMTILVVLGALLTLIGIVGGGFEIKQAKIPKVGRLPRILALVLGIGLLGLALYFQELADLKKALAETEKNLEDTQREIKAEKDSLARGWDGIKKEQERLDKEAEEAREAKRDTDEENLRLAEERGRIESERDHLALERHQIESQWERLEDERRGIEAEKDSLAEEWGRIESEWELLKEERLRIEAEPEEAHLAPTTKATGQLYCFAGGGVDFPGEEFDARVFFIDCGIRTETKNGFLVTGGAGYQILPNLRLEGQIGYRSSKIDNVKLKYIYVDGVGVKGGSGDITSLSLMANAWCDFLHRGPWSPYFGGGVGIAQVSLKDFVLKTAPFLPNAPITETLLADDKDSKLAYQFGAGLKYRLNERFIIDLGYRYFSTLEPELADVVGNALQVDYSHQSVQLGITYTF